MYNIDDIFPSTTEFDQLVALNNDPNTINFYIVNNSIEYSGKAGGITNRNLVIRGTDAISFISAHELGHCFNLFHTFQGTKPFTNGCAKLPNNSNCSICGDYVCDTPADSGSGTVNGYSPDITNIMSYYGNSNHFSILQGERMRNAINGSPLLASIKSTQCNKITGPNVICTTANFNYAFSNPNNINVIWSLTPNLQIVSSSNTKITIKAPNLATGGPAKITANINGLLITKEIWVGKLNSGSITGISAVCRSVSYDYYAIVPGGHKANYTYRWTMPNAYWQVYSQQDNRIHAGPVVQNLAGQMLVEVNNGCGWSGMGGLIVYPNPNCTFGYSYKVYPNPIDSSSSLTIEKISSSTETIQDYTKSKTDLVVDGENFEVEIKDLTGKIRIPKKNYKKQISTRYFLFTKRNLSFICSHQWRNIATKNYSKLKYSCVK